MSTVQLILTPSCMAGNTSMANTAETTVNTLLESVKAYGNRHHISPCYALLQLSAPWVSWWNTRGQKIQCQSLGDWRTKPKILAL